MAERKKGPRYYSTVKPVQKSVAEIMSLLSEFGAESFHVQQQGGVPSAIAFVLRGVVFQMAPSFEGLARRIEQEGVSRHVKSAEAVAWAQFRNLLELQLEAVESGLMTPEAMFGGHALTSAGRTVAEMIEERHGELMPGETRLLPPARNG